MIFSEFQLSPDYLDPFLIDFLKEFPNPCLFWPPVYQALKSRAILTTQNPVRKSYVRGYM